MSHTINHFVTTGIAGFALIGVLVAPVFASALKAYFMTNVITVEFSNPEHFNRLLLIHDSVMGGRSDGNVVKTDSDSVQFYGTLSLENNGGFASVEFSLRHQLPAPDFNRLTLSAKADNRTYQLRLKTAYLAQGIAYAAEFKGINEESRYQFSPADFAGRYRGRLVTDLPKLNFADVTQVSLMLADKTPGPFNIELDSIEFSQTSAD